MEQIPTKKCSQCQMDISIKAKKCPHCQSKVKQPMSIIVKLFLGLMVFGIFSSIIFSSGGDSTPEPEVTNYKFTASVFAELYVQRILKSPSTADFCRGNVIELGNNKYEISSCVDSQNSFGAMLRSNWEAVMVYNGGDPDDVNNWTIEKLIFDGKTIY